MTYTIVFAAPISFHDSEPTNGTEISTFNIQLKFDVSETIQKQGTDNLGIRYVGDSYGCTYLYEGNDENGKLLAKFWEDSQTIETSLSGSNLIISLPIPSSLIPEPDKNYTIICRNEFDVKNLETGKVISGALIDYYDAPLILTFKGIAPSSGELIYQKSSIEENQNLEKISNIDFEFNEEFEILDKNGVQILYDNEVVYTATNLQVDPENLKKLKVSFDDAILYLANHQYTLTLYPGTICLKGNTSETNRLVEININGLSTKTITTKSAELKSNSFNIPEVAEIRFNLENGQTLTPPGSISHKREIDLFKGEILENNFIKTLYGIAKDDGITWDLSTISFEPNTQYTLFKEANDITVWINGKESPAFGNEEVVIKFSTPSIEDLNLLPITVGVAKIGRYDNPTSTDFIDEETYAHISTVEIKREDYNLNGKVVKPNLNTNGDHNAYVYDVTDGSRKLVKDVVMFTAGRGGDDDGGLIIPEYSVFGINLNMDFLQNHMYEIVIPKGALRLNSVQYPSWYNYVINDEIVYKVKGATPSEFKVESCSVINNAEVSNLPGAIIWTINGIYALKNNNVFADCKSSGNVWGNSKCPLTIQVEGNKSYVAVQLFDRKTGNIGSLVKGQIYTVTIPASSIVYPGDESLTNPELTVTLNGIEAEKPKAEMVNVNLTVNGLHTTAHQSPKGEAYSFNFKPASEWVVESVKHGNKVLDENADGMFVTEPLNQDAELTAELKYDGPWMVESSSGVYTIEDSNIQVFTEQGMIVVDGVSASDIIHVYNVGGMLIDYVVPQQDRVYITVAPSQIYIVTVNNHAAKIQL